jgi:8-oxo-dGTP diphosphatase
VSAVFYSFVVADTQPVAADDAADAAWVPLRTLPLPSREGAPHDRRKIKLAFDHAMIIDDAHRRLQERLIDPARRSPFEIVPSHFTLAELQRVYEAVLGRPINRRTFRARLVARGIVEPVTQARRARKTPASDLYRFKPPFVV